MITKILGLFTAILIFIVDTFPMYPGPDVLHQGINPDPRPYVRYSSTAGYIFKEGDTELPFRLVKPEAEEEGKTYPLVVYLHGAGERGNNNIAQMQRSMLRGIEKHGESCYILMPQVFEDNYWADDAYDAALTKLIEYMLKCYAVDSSRIYITGISMGGAGVLDQLLRHPGKYAAAMPVCGYTTVEDLTAFAGTPMWLAHNFGDKTVFVEHSRNIYAAVKDISEAKYTEYDRNGHNAWDRFYSDPEVWNWAFSKSL